jgi:hypothetical protein
MTPRWVKVLAVVGCLFLALLFHFAYLSRKTETMYAHATVAHLRSDRDWALRSDAPKAATILGYILEGTNTKQRPGTTLDQMCSLERSNAIADIIAYLRTKTGEDLGGRPEPWIQKYATKD